MKPALAAICIAAVLLAAAFLISDALRSDAPASAPVRDDQPPPQAAPDPGWESIPPIPPFTMTDQTGSEVTQAVLDGHVTILTFFFTNCQSVCPMMNGVMFDLTRRLADTPVRFCSISVDPEHDTTQALRDYADKWGVPDHIWRFLRADEQTLHRIVRDTIGFDLAYKDNLLDIGQGRQIRDIQHPGVLLLVDPQRRILARYQYQWNDDVSALEQRARTLARWYADRSPGPGSP